jgi:hypothetical protein
VRREVVSLSDSSGSTRASAPPVLSHDADRASFADLRQRLPAIWRGIHCRPHTSVVVPSLSFDQTELAKIEGVPFYEE